MKNILSFVIAIMLVFSMTGPFLQTASGKEAEPVLVIQNRVFHKNHELSLSFGYVADDDFFNVYPVGISYTFNFSDHIAWEVARAQFNLTREKDLKGNLENEFGATPSEFTEPIYSIHSSFVLKPFYGKESIYNKRVINHETYFLLGAGIANFERKKSYGDPDTENAISIGVGVGKKYYINKHLCVNFELRDYVNLKEDNTQNTIFFGMSLGLRFNLLPRKTDSDKTIETLNDYLKMGDSNAL
ncbi:MAG: outer membrane beta-barrel domain-containing protein [Proteobacteria bacterium]|nr:outer membrane beta-barrel domain-containing protein [Pseudomonadota bacterium]